MSIFPATDKRPSDVLKVDVEGEDLHRLNGVLAGLPHVDTQPTYRPHATIAYLKPGTGAIYVALLDPLNIEVEATRLVFSDRNRGQTVIPIRADPEGFSFDTLDVVTQRASSQHFYLVDGRLEAFPVEFRYVWPSELDLMAQLAGMRLRDRWDGWDRTPFTHESRQHVSVWEKPAE